MTPKQKALVRRSWAGLGAEADATTDLFYRRLFEVNPNAQRLFRNKELRLQGLAFNQMLAMFLRSLDDDEPGLTEVIQACGRRHVGYGVMFSDYDGVGEALLWALEQQLGPRFSPAMREAWAAAYQSLASTMRQVSSSVL